MKFIQIVFLLLFICPSNLFSQEKEFLNYIKNPSFEGKPKASALPSNWADCGGSNGTAPDTQPYQFKVSTMPQNGLTYIGMVVRDNDTRESISSKLLQNLEKDSTYYLTCWLARSSIYLSRSSLTGLEANYDSPCELHLYIGNNYCSKKQLIAKSEKIENEHWKEYTFEFVPKKDYNFFIIEAAHQNKFPYNGNLLIDNLSLYKLKNK